MWRRIFVKLPYEKPYVLGDWEVHPTNCTIRNKDQSQVLPPQIYALLNILVIHSGQVVSRAMLLESVWKDTVVSDDSISRAIADLRRYLGDSARSPRYIATHSKKGYKLLVEPKEITPGAPNTVNLPKLILLISIVAIPLCMVLIWMTWHSRDTYIDDEPVNYSQGLAKFPLDSRSYNVVRRPRFDSLGRFVVAEAANELGQQSIIVYDLDRNENFAIEPDVNQLFALPTFTRSGNEVIYFRYTSDQNDDESCEIIIRVFKTAKESSIGSCENLFRGSFATSIDGLSIYASEIDIDKVSAAIVSIDIKSGEREQVLAPAKSHQAYMFPRMSPSGDKLAFVSNAVGTGISSLVVLDISSGETSELAREPQIIEQVEWGSENELIYAVSGKFAEGIWTIDITNGTKKLLRNIEVKDFDFNRNSKEFVLGIPKYSNNIYESALDGEEVGETKLLVASEARDYSPRYSHSGETLGFVSSRGLGPNIWTRNLESGNEQSITQKDGSTWNLLDWSPDDQYLLAIETTPIDSELVMLELRSGKQMEIDIASVLHASWLANDKLLVVAEGLAGKQQLIEFNVVNNVKTTIYEGELQKAFAVNSAEYLIQPSMTKPLYRLKIIEGSSEPKIEQLLSERRIGAWLYSDETISMLTWEEGLLIDLFDINELAEFQTESRSVLPLGGRLDHSFSPGRKSVAYSRKLNKGFSLVWLRSVH
jgi:DNA-binding winged helix-turn-helix (wHTH) protein/Tol biopolymer transport system component